MQIGYVFTTIVCFLHLEISSVLEAISLEGNCHDSVLLHGGAEGAGTDRGD